MAAYLGFSTSIFESFGVLSSFSVTETIWEKYETFATNKMKDATLKLRGSLYYLKDLSANDAQKELNTLSPLMPVLLHLRKAMEQADKKKFLNYQSIVLEFFETVDFLYFNLQDIADVHSTYEQSKPVLAADWERPEDEHWNNY